MATSITTDIPLYEKGKKRAEALKDSLRSQHLNYIYSTNYNRTRSTALPLAEELNLRILL